MRYRLDVVAADVADVVMHAGGWLFDRTMAGWDVTVLVADHSDDRPLHILGVATLDLEYALATVGERPAPQTLAASADLFGCDSRIRHGILLALDHGATEVTLWGRSCPAELAGSTGIVHHRLSAAARAFKAHALAAAGIATSSVASTERFRSQPLLRSAVGADLVPSR